MSLSESANTSVQPAGNEQAALAGPDTGQVPTLTQADLVALAEKVYALLKVELRIERERMG